MWDLRAATTGTVEARSHPLRNLCYREGCERAGEVAIGVAVLQPSHEYDVKGSTGDHTHLAASGDFTGQLPRRDGDSHPP